MAVRVFDSLFPHKELFSEATKIISRNFIDLFYLYSAEYMSIDPLPES